MSNKPTTMALQGGNQFATGLLRFIGVGSTESGATSLLDYSTNSLGMILRQSFAQVNGTQAAGMWGSDTEGAYVAFNGTNQDARGADTGFPTTNAARTIALRLSVASGTPTGYIQGYGTSGDSILGIGVDSTSPYSNSPYLGTNNVAQLTRNAVAVGTPKTLIVSISSGGGVTFFLDGTQIQQYDANSDSPLSAGTPLSGINTALSGYHYLAQQGGTGGGGSDGTQGNWSAPKIYGLGIWNYAFDQSHATSLQSDFYQVVRPVVSIAASPSTFTCGAVNVPITLTGSGTSWGGTVGGTCTLGTLSSQSISGQVISALYTPGTTPGTVTFGDSAIDDATGTGTINPAPPTNVSAVGGNTNVTLSWTNGAGSNKVNVYQGTSPSGESGTPVKTGISGTSTTVTGLTNNTTYYFYLKSFDSSGVYSSSASSEVSGVPASAPTITPTSANVGLGLTFAFSVSGFTPTSWDTSNHAIATVNGSGVLTGISGGSCTVTATDGTHTVTASVTVVPVYSYFDDAQFPTGNTITFAYYDPSAGTSYSWTYLSAREIVSGAGVYSITGYMPAATNLEIWATAGDVIGTKPWNPTTRQGYSLANSQNFNNTGQTSGLPVTLTTPNLNAIANAVMSDVSDTVGADVATILTKIGTPANSTVSNDIAAVKSDVDGVKSDLDGGVNVTKWGGSTVGSTPSSVSTPIYGTVVANSTASAVILSGLPAGKYYVGQYLYHEQSGEKRLVSSQAYSGGNYTLSLGTGTGTSGPFSAAPSVGDLIYPV